MIIEAMSWNVGLSDAIRLRVNGGEIFFYARRIEAVFAPPVLFLRERSTHNAHIGPYIKRIIGDRCARVVQTKGEELHDMAVSVMAASVAEAFDERMLATRN